MKSLSLFAFLILISSLGKSAAQQTKKSRDTIELPSRILEQMRTSKQNIKKVIYQFETRDSSIYFSSDKQKKFLSLVYISDRKTNSHKWFYYDTSGLFRVQIIQRAKEGKPKKVYFNYYFDDGNSIHKSFDNAILDPDNFLIEANQYKKMAGLYLDNH